MKLEINSSSSSNSSNIQNFLYEISKLSLQNIELTDFLKEIHSRISIFMSAKNFYVALYHEEIGKYSFPYYVDENDSTSSTEYEQLDNTLTDYIRKSGNAEIITSKREKEIFQNSFNVIGAYSKVWIGAPLINPSNSKVIGVIALQDYDNDTAYSEEDLKTLVIIASDIGLFIERINNYKKLEESEKRFRTIFDETKTVNLVTDYETGKILEANEAAISFYGYPDLTSKYIYDINQQPKIEVLEYMHKAIHKELNIFEFKHKLASGQIRDVEVYSSPMTISGKQVLFSIIHDITDRKITEKALKESQDKLKKAEKIAHVGNYEINLKTGETTWSEELFRIFSLDSQANNIPSLEEFREKYVHPDDLTYFNDSFRQSLKDKQDFNIIFRVKIKNNSIRYLHIIGKIRISKIDQAEFLFGTVQDITEQKEKEEIIKSNRDELSKANATKDKFFSIIAHDLRNPFQILLNTTELLKEDILNNRYDDADELINSIYNSANNNLNLLEDLLLWSRSQSNSMEFHPVQIDLKDFIANEIKLNNTLAEKKGIKLSYSIVDKLSIYADENMLRFIIRNLIINAIKFTNKNGSIKLSAKAKKQFVEIGVTDTGIGMDEEQIENLFRVDQRTTSLGTEKEKGTGLGLVLCKEFVEMHEGNITVESKVGQGSKFRISLPVE